MCKSEYIYNVQLKSGVTVAEFTAAIVPALADRADWLTGLPLSWIGHPQNKSFQFAVVETNSPGGCIVAGVDETVSAQIVVTFGDDAGAANWAAFSMGYSRQLVDSAFSAGAGALSY